ncbi:hypothetical protein RQM47_01030 [Rubrivirga sp. S365]|uniref:DoxX-like protein n=1 Tax=Rubrivirga litoralis TaxID=3075598 RepID=A0ABU3BSZ6_9BACT|nr:MULTISPECIES: hypothetical protein [unclassified Rubrivirga]MDT0632411.1 hypothetical protein [Rubrivirga sp. F394]MDT7855218.1 hypothetical protein [Rubrivirga sp. S365]
MVKVVTAARYLLGVLLLVLGLNGFLDVIPQPPPPDDGGAFLGALVSGGVLPVVKAFEVVVGVLLLAGRFVPLALVVLVPITVGILLYHVRFDPAGGVAAYLVAVLHGVLLWGYRAHLMPLLVPRAEPLPDRRPAPPAERRVVA